MTSTKTYDARVETHRTAVGRRLLAIMARKRTNLCVSLDIPDPERILALLSGIPSSPPSCHNGRTAGELSWWEKNSDRTKDLLR